jgi:O-antigen/teichoic acid export membrane protein
MPHVLAGAVLTSADRFAVAGQMSVGALGIYGAASQLGLIVNVLGDAANKAYIPFLYGMLGQDSAASRLRVVAITYFSIPLWILTALVVWAVVMVTGGWLLGSGYADALSLSIWFMLGGAVNGIYLSISGLFFFSGKTEWISIATSSAAVLALLIAVPMVQRFGVVGGGITYLLSQLTMCCVAWGLSARKVPMPWGQPVLAARTLVRSVAGAT